MVTTMACNKAASANVLKGITGKIGIFAPEHRQLLEPWDTCVNLLYPILKSTNKSDGFIKTINGGHIDFWHVNDNPLAGRGKDYDMILGDEIAFAKAKQMLDVWEKNILPTLATRPQAESWFFCTPNGNNPDNFFHKICNDPTMGFREFHAPSLCNPAVSQAWIEKQRAITRPDVFAQEYLAEWIDWSGAAFFDLAKLLVAEKPVPLPESCDYVFAILDTATKTGRSNDGTGVLFAAYNQFSPQSPLTILDWDYVQIEGALLETWLPTVYERLEWYAGHCKARYGSLGCWIEDKASGMILLQQAQRRGWKATPLDSKLTSVGKDERAISVSGYVYREQVKLATPAFEKNVSFKENSANHLIKQVTGYRIGQKDQQDDLLDCFAYAISTALGNGDGI